MILMDALQKDNSYSQNSLKDTPVVMTAEGLENLVDSVISDYTGKIPSKDEVSSVVMEAFNSVKEEIKDSLKSLTDRYVSGIRMSGSDMLDSELKVQGYVDAVREIVFRGLETAAQRSEELASKNISIVVPDSDSLKSMISEGISELEDELHDYYKPLISSESSTSNQPKTHQVWENLGDTVKRNFDTDSFGSVGNTWKGVGSELVNNYSEDSIGAELSKPIADFVSNFVNEVLEVPTQEISRSDAFNAIVNPFSVISGIVSEVSSEAMRSFNKSYEDVIKTSVGAVDEIYNAGKERVTDALEGVVSKVTGKLGEISDNIVGKVQGWRDNTLKLLKPNKMQLENTEFKNGNVHYDLKDSFSGIAKSWRSLRSNGEIPVRRTDFVINRNNGYADLYMSNDAFWDIKIVPHKHNGDDGPPDLNKIFGCESSKRLPILSYTLDAGGLSSSSFEIYPGVQFSVPISYSRPSALSFSILNLVKVKNSEHTSCLDVFRDSYINRVVGVNIESTLDSLPACLDYHYCAYEIEICKYSQQWMKLREWKLLGIPQITVYEQGNSASSQEIQTLNFSIVGVGESSSYAFEAMKNINPTNRENLEPEEGWSPGANRGYYEE